MKRMEKFSRDLARFLGKCEKNPLKILYCVIRYPVVRMMFFGRLGEMGGGIGK